MRKMFLGSMVLLLFVMFLPGASLAQQGRGQFPKMRVMTPSSSIEKSGDLGVASHTHLRMLVPPGGHFGNSVQPAELPPFLGLFFETPASIACVYGLVDNPRPGCDPDKTTKNPTGGGGAIALVDAFDNPTAASDLATFSTQFGLPAADFTVVYASGTQPKQDPTGGWEIEESLDVQWAHAMAPNAKIFLVEAATNKNSDLFPAIALAASIVAAHGGGEVSMSFGGGEFTQETTLDEFFTTPGVVYIASTGDSPGPEYPSTSPFVVAAGGTTLSRDANTGRFLLESAWQDAGGGASFVEPRPSFQNSIEEIVGPARGTPDLSFDANPNTGLWVFDTNSAIGTGWFVVGGTSASAPSLAGIINAAGRFSASSAMENHEIYRQIGNSRNFYDVFYGNCGFNIGSFATFGWDFCTGVGSPRGLRGK
jgi:kumamolisin